MAESWPDDLVGATRAGAEAALAARGLAPGSWIARVAGWQRPGAELRVMRVRWLGAGADRLELVYGGFLSSSGILARSPGASATGPGHAEVRP